MNVAAKYQTFNKRWLASSIDSLIFLPFTLLAHSYERSSDHQSFIIYTSLHVILYSAYLVIGHGKYGQTLGKALLGIKVLDINEANVIGVKKAFLRESPWFLAQMAGIVYLLFSTGFSDEALPIHETYFRSIVGSISTIWLLLEIFTMFFNSKRRALHDLIAGSVVVTVVELKREELSRKREELMASLNHLNKA